MRLRAGDVFGVEALVEIDRGVDAAHDLGGTTGKAAAPQRVRRFACAGHRPTPRARGEEETTKWVAAALMVLLATLGLGATAEDRPDTPDRTKLGEFVPSSEPFPAPGISL